jgi:hypothetical protein
MVKKEAVFVVLLVMACLAFAQPAAPQPTDTEPYGTGSFSAVSGLYTNVLNYVLMIVDTSVDPLPGDALMQSKICASTGNSLLDTFAFKVDIFSLSALAAVAGVMFIAFIFMLGKLLDNKRWVEYAKNELFEIAVTIFVVLVLLLPLMKIMGCFNPFEAGVSTYQAAFAYPKDILASLTPFSIGLYLITGIGQKLILQIQVVQSIFVQAAGGFGSASDDATLGTSSTAGMVVVVTTALASLMAYLHELVTYGFVAYLLPLGLVLRFFAPTRRVGGTLIALTFGMGILVPFLFAIGHSVIAKDYFPFYYNAGGSSANCLAVPGTHICANPRVLTSGVKSLADRIASIAMGSGEAATAQNDYLNQGTTPTDNGNTLYENQNAATEEPNLFTKLLFILFSFAGSVMEIVMLSSGGGVLCFGGTVYPLIVSIILINGVKYMSSTLGEEIDVSNLSRLI